MGPNIFSATNEKPTNSIACMIFVNYNIIIIFTQLYSIIIEEINVKKEFLL